MQTITLMLFRVHARDPSDYHFFSSLPTAPSRGLPWRKPNGIFFADVLQEAHRVQHGRQHRCLRSFWMLELYLALKRGVSSAQPQPQLQNNRKRHDIEQEKQTQTKQPRPLKSHAQNLVWICEVYSPGT